MTIAYNHFFLYFMVLQDGSRNVLTQCYSTYLNWYQAKKKCLRQRGYLPTYTPSNQKCDLYPDLNMEDHWHNTFIKEKIIWDKGKNFKEMKYIERQ